MPNYWLTIADFAKAGIPVVEVKTLVENLQYLNEAVFSIDKKLLSELYTTEGVAIPTRMDPFPVGVKSEH